MSIRRIAFCVLSAAFVAAPAAASSNNWTYSELNKTVPGASGNSPEDDARPGEYYFMRGVEAVNAGDYTHAIDMYQVAASWGYKDAQYNLGVIYAKGQGVPVDLPRAMAWMALAAERNDKRYVEARELVYSLLDKQQWDQANALWRDMKLTYADAVALPRAKARWAEARNGATGSHLGSPGGRLEVGSWSDNSGLVKTSTATDHVQGVQVPTVGRSAADIIGPNTVDGSVAYGALRATDNPYDPRFDPVGTATVQPPQPVGENKTSEPGHG